MILILTGPTRSHKTTTLREWSERRTDCGGVLSPDVDGLRVLYNVKTKATIPWQHKTPMEGDSIVGRFSFDPNGFLTGYTWLHEHMADPDIRYVVLDEVGKLELAGKGWDTWLRSAFPLPEDKTLVLVIRRTLLDEIITRYQLEEVSVVDREYFT